MLSDREAHQGNWGTVNKMRNWIHPVGKQSLHSWEEVSQWAVLAVSCRLSNLPRGQPCAWVNGEKELWTPEEGLSSGNKCSFTNSLPTAHLKLLPHPLRKTKGSVLLSTVKYTHIPQQHLCPALSSHPDNSLQLINSRAGWAQERLSEGHCSASSTAWNEGSSLALDAWGGLVETPPWPWSPNLARRSSWDAAHSCVDSQRVLPAPCWYFHTAFLPDLPQAAEFLARQRLQGTHQAAICLHLFMFTKNSALFPLTAKLVMLSKKATSCLLYYLP